ncbi:WD40-repeat-containing domain [Pseudocohnilembus persalinus]|uniref:WD40-repeat-containing domain n=1 Tax=Pseudocohnilembus persalinus TaxID=266149 RepID=A0A0V0R1M2_PSEPJ|nr:WD40-repeat-containing domain [Pseudocohnilembus persalinus]|eukprot:KRX08439.1 WD40-repeat-containing domain [Pseudocohnilembus persalinus]
MERSGIFRDEAKGIIRNISTGNDPQLVRSFRGHTGAINTATFDPKMRQIATGGDDGLAYVWSFKPNQRPFKFVGHKGAVLDVQFSPDGETIATAGYDRQIRLWKNSVQNKCKVIKCHAGAIRSVHFSKDGNLLLSASDDKTLKIWNTKQWDKKFVASMPGHKNWVKSGQFAPDNRIIASGSDDKTVKLWDVDTSKLVHTYDDHTNGVNSVRFTPDGTCVASASKDSSIKIFDVRSHKLIQHYDAHQSDVNSISFHPSGYYLASAGKDSKLKIWDLRKGNLAWTLYSHKAQARSIDFNLGGDYFVSGGDDNVVMVWKTNFDEDIDVESIKPIAQIGQDNEYSTGGLTTQTLFKSNKVYNPQSAEKNKNKGSPSKVKQQVFTDGFEDKENLEQTFGNQQEQQQLTQEQRLQQEKLSEILSGSLEKIVNQLDLVSHQIVKLDDRLSKNENSVKQLFENEKVQDIVERFEKQENNNQPIQQSVWEGLQEQQGLGVAPGFIC